MTIGFNVEEYKNPDVRREMAFVPCTHKSTNTIYAGKHFRERNRDKENIADHFSTSPARRIKPFTKPVNLKFVPVISKGVKSFDTSNYSYGAKMIEDCLVKYGVLQDDTNKHVKNVELMPPVRGAFSGFLVIITEQSIDHVAYLEYMHKLAVDAAY